MRQSEYNAVLIISDAIVPSLATTALRTTKSAFSNDTSTRKTSSNIGLKLSSKYATISLSEDAKTDNETDELLSSHSLLRLLKKIIDNSTLDLEIPDDFNLNPDINQTNSESFSLCMSIREPLITMLSVHSETFFSLVADDLNMYEMSVQQFESLNHEKFQFNKPTSINETRFGSQKFKVPFIHRAFIRSNLSDSINSNKQNGKSFGTYSTLLGKNNVYGHAFEVRLLLTSSLRMVEQSHSEVILLYSELIDLLSL